LNPKVFKADWRCSGARLLADEPENLAPSAGAIRRFGGNTHCNNVSTSSNGLFIARFDEVMRQWPHESTAWRLIQ